MSNSNIYEDLKLDPNKIYYHGTNHKFDKFDKSKIRENKLGLCFNFTDDMGIAYQYGNNIIKVHLDLKNPLTLDLWQDIFPYEWFNRFAKLFCDDEDYEYDKDDYEKHPYTYGKFFNTYGDKPEGVQVFEEMGYDGIAIPEDNHYGVFEPEQIHIINDVKEIYELDNKPIIAYRAIDDEFKLDFNNAQWFSSQKHIASSYGQNLYRAELILKNPLDLTDKNNNKYFNDLLGLPLQDIQELFKEIFEDLDKIKDDYGSLESDINYIKTLVNKQDFYNACQNIEELLYKKRDYLSKIIDIKLMGLSLTHLYKLINRLQTLQGNSIIDFNFVYKHWKEVIQIAKQNGFDSIISIEEAKDLSDSSYGFVIWNKNNIKSIQKVLYEQQCDKTTINFKQLNEQLEKFLKEI